MPPPPSRKTTKNKKVAAGTRRIDGAILRLATELGCESILQNIFDYLLTSLAAFKLEVVSHQPPHIAGALSLADRLAKICARAEELVGLKLNYRRLFAAPQRADHAFTALKEMLSKLQNLEKLLRRAAARGERKASAAIGSAKLLTMRLVVEVGRCKKSIESSIAREASSLSSHDTSPARLPREFSAPRTVVAVDMVAYGRMSLSIEDLAFEDQAAVLMFNDGIRKLLEKALIKVSRPHEAVASINTGDGGIFFFAKATHAARFALQIREYIDAINLTNQGTDKQFRIGLSTGTVALRETRDADGQLLRFDAGGAIIARAVRTMAACAPGDITVCRETFLLIQPKLRAKFSEDVIVTGKPHENMQIKAHKSAATPPPSSVTDTHKPPRKTLKGRRQHPARMRN